ncbi:MAG: hypothetical protein ACOX2F_05325 [bacterium]
MLTNTESELVFDDKRRNSGTLTLLKQHRKLAKKAKKALLKKTEIDFPFDVFIDEAGTKLVVEIEMPGLTMGNINIYNKNRDIRWRKK